MRKVLFTLLAVFLSIQVVSAASTLQDTGTVRQVPIGIKVIDLHTPNTAESKDTIATTAIQTYGPYELCNDGDAMPTKFVVVGDVITGTTPVAAVDYQLIAGTRIQDTLSAWTACDSLGTAATNQEVTLSGAGKAIVFRVNNYDDTETQIPGRLRIVIPTSTTVYKMKR